MVNVRNAFQNMPKSQSYTITFRKKKLIAKDTFSFYFTRPKGFEFLAGQYNRITLPMTATDGRGTSRFFTIASPPSEKDFLIVTTKIVQSDFKKELLNLQENQEINIFGPMGQFVVDENNTGEHIFIAGGIGITPFYSMLIEAAASKNTKQLTLFASFPTPEEATFLYELTKLTETHPTITSIYTITKPEKSQTPWKGEKGRISESLIKKYVKGIATSIFYIVGPPRMVEETQKLLEKMKVPNEHIRTEQFSGY